MLASEGPDGTLSCRLAAREDSERRRLDCMLGFGADFRHVRMILPTTITDSTIKMNMKEMHATMTCVRNGACMATTGMTTFHVKTSTVHVENHFRNTNEKMKNKNTAFGGTKKCRVFCFRRDSLSFSLSTLQEIKRSP